MDRERTEAIALPFPRPAVLSQELVWPLLVALSTAAAIVPLWASQVLPYQDAPQHVAAVRVLADYHTPGLGFDRWFELDLGRLQYLGFYLPAAAIAKVTSADVAVRLMLSLIAVATSAAFWMFLGAFGRDRRLAVFAPAAFHTTALYLGFFNFVESIPLALVVVALTERELRGPSLGRTAGTALAAAALLWLHPSALAFVLSMAVVLAVTSGEGPRKIARALVPLLPALILFGAWALQALATRDGPGHVASAPPRWLGLKLQVLEFLRFGNVLAGNVDELFVLSVVGLFLAVVAVGPRPPLLRGWRVPLVAALALAVYLVTPFEMGYMGYIHTRAMPFIVLLVIASPAIAPGRKTAVLLTAVVALQMAYQARVAAAYRAFDREAEISELRQVLHAAEPGKSLIALIMSGGSQVVQKQAYLHFAAYYEVMRGGRSRYNFAETPWTPIRYRPGTEPVPLPRSWEVRPEDLDIDKATADEDYVLVREPGPVPKRFQLLERAGRWALYAPAARR